MDKKERYRSMAQKATGLLDGELDKTANLANLAALLREDFAFFWVGFYLVKGEELVLGPFQGPVACTRIAKGKGVCGAAWSEEKSQLVTDVHLFPGHIACNAQSASEVVVPIMVDGQVLLVLDVDSDKKADFDQEDVQGLEDLCRIIASAYPQWEN